MIGVTQIELLAMVVVGAVIVTLIPLIFGISIWVGLSESEV